MVNKLIVEISEENIIDLDINIYNDSVTIKEEDVIVRMVVEGDNNLNYFFDGERSGSGYAITVPRLKGKLNAGDRSCIIEVVCHDRYFRAWEGLLELKEETKIDVKPRMKTKVIENTQINVTPTTRVIKNSSEKKVAPKTSSKTNIKSNDVMFEIVMDKPVRPLKKKVVKKKKVLK
jgi:hypothetical protein